MSKTKQLHELLISAKLISQEEYEKAIHKLKS